VHGAREARASAARTPTTPANASTPSASLGRDAIEEAISDATRERIERI